MRPASLRHGATFRIVDSRGSYTRVDGLVGWHPWHEVDGDPTRIRQPISGASALVVRCSYGEELVVYVDATIEIKKKETER